QQVATFSTAALRAGTHTVTASFADATNTFSVSSGTTTVVVARAKPKVTWTPPAAIAYGTALGGAQLSASANVDGAMAYNPASGTVLGAGSQTLAVTFTPSDTTDYETVSASVPLTVTPATLTVTAGDASRAYGVDNPAFSASYSGFVNGETPA